MPDLETEEDAADFYEKKEFKIKKSKERILYLEKKIRDNKLLIE